MGFASKLLRQLYGRTDYPARKRPAQYDVLLSVWNGFHSAEERMVFLQNGLLVHWVGNNQPPVRNETHKRSFDWLSFFVFASSTFLRTGYWGVYTSLKTFDLYSGSRRLNTRLVWAFVKQNTRLVRRAKRKGIPVVLDVPIAHMEEYCALEGEYRDCGVPFPTRWIHWCAKTAASEYALADWCVAGSSYVKETLVRRGVNPRKIFVVPYGVEASRWERCHRNRKPYRERMVFIFTAGMTPRKGFQYLVRAWKRSSMLQEKAELWVCGGTKAGMDWNKVCDGLPPGVQFFGFVSHEKLEELYSQASVYVLASLMEGLARSGLEALSAGLPAVVTWESGLTDFVQDGREGWVVPSRDAEALRSRLEWCVENREAVAQAGELAYQRLRNQTFAEFGNRCAAIAKAIIEGRDPSAEMQDVWV